MDPIAIVFLTVVACLGYILLFAVLQTMLVSVTLAFKGASWLKRLVLLIPFLILGIVYVALDIIHTLLLIWFGLGLLSGIRTWWHKVH